MNNIINHNIKGGKIYCFVLNVKTNSINQLCLKQMAILGMVNQEFFMMNIVHIVMLG